MDSIVFDGADNVEFVSVMLGVRRRFTDRVGTGAAGEDHYWMRAERQAVSLG